MAKRIKTTDLKPGDILFYRKTKFINKAISFFDDCKYNHNSLYLGNNMVIESIIKGTVIRDIETSIADAKRILVKRLHNAPQDMTPVINASKEYEGDRYAYEEILMLALICTVRKIRLSKFVSRFVEKILETAGAIILQFTNGDKEAVTCSELVYRCYDEAETGDDNPYAIHLNRFDEDATLDEREKAVHKESILAHYYGSDNNSIYSENTGNIEASEMNEKELRKTFRKLRKAYKKAKVTAPEEKEKLKKSLDSFITSVHKAKNSDEDNALESFIKDNANFVTPGDLYHAGNLDEIGRLK